jgi:hypothetical protein
VLPPVLSTTTLPGDELASIFGSLDQAECHTILIGRGRVEHLELDPHLSPALMRQSGELDQGRPPDRRQGRLTSAYFPYHGHILSKD